MKYIQEISYKYGVVVIINRKIHRYKTHYGNYRYRCYKPYCLGKLLHFFPQHIYDPYHCQHHRQCKHNIICIPFKEYATGEHVIRDLRYHAKYKQHSKIPPLVSRMKISFHQHIYEYRESYPPQDIKYITYSRYYSTIQIRIQQCLIRMIYEH